MSYSIPLKFQEIIKLTSLELGPSCFKFGVCNLESDVYLSADEKMPNGESFMTIVELQNNFKYTRKPNKADGLMMHPVKNIIALKAKNESGTGSVLQIFNMDEKQKIKSIDFPEIITFWKWINEQKLACVTQSGVYSVDITTKDNNFQKIMDKYDNLKEQGTQIIGYCSDSQEKWGALYGIGSNDGGKTINGYIQLYLIADQKQQILEGHCCTFGQGFMHNGSHKSELFCFVQKKANEQAKLHITEISAPPQGFQKFKKNVDFIYSPEQQSDFPIYMQISNKFGIIYVLTKFGYLSVFELSSCQQLFKTRISQEPVFVGARNRQNDGFLTISKTGSLFSVQLDESQLVPFIMNQCTHIPDNRQIGIQLATKYGLAGADGMFLESFNRALAGQEYQKAAQIAAQSPGTLLRNSETINKLKSIQAIPGQPQPILIYFQTLIEKGSLNKIESIELCKPLIAQGKKQLIENWMNDKKLEASEELGDIVKMADVHLAIKIYEKSKAQNKFMQCLMETGQTERAMQFSSQMGVKPDYVQMLRSMIPLDPQGAMNMAIKACQSDNSINIFTVAEIFLQNNRLAELTQFLLECMKNNRQEDAPWQTQVLELNLMAAPQVADAILNMEIWNQYNKQKIAVLCEQKGLYQKALENYQDIKDIKRICLNAHMLNVEWFVQYMGKQSPENGLVILQEMIRHNRQLMQIVVQTCSNNYARYGVQNCVKIFESVSSFDGLFYFLGGIIQNTQDQDVHYKYIEASVKVNQLKEVERIIRDKKDCYDPVKVKDFLKQIKLQDPIPLIVLCDQHGFIDELIKYLYKNNFNRFIEIYILKYNPNSSAVVLGTLIDLECEENYLKQILFNLRGNCALEPLIAEFDKRNRLRVLENWLDSRIAEGNQLPAIHNAIAKIKIDSNQDPQNFLLNNQFYDSKVVGQYCEDRDPHLAYTAYKRAWGQCDNELIQVTNKNALYRLQARYLVERQSKEVWALVLNPENPHRKAIVEQVVAAALPESKNVDEVSCTVQAFMQADLPLELLSLLEKIVLHNSEFGQYKKLQHLLIITAIKSDSSRVMDYIKRLDNYDGPAIAVIAIEHELYEEAFEIYRKQNYSEEALSVLLQNIGDISRATEFAEKIGKPEVWSQLGHAYLNNNAIDQAIDCYLKSNDASQFSQLILYGELQAQVDKFITYLLMARTNIKDQIIDNALCFAYAKTNKINELEEFIKNPNSTDVQRVGDRCYEEKLYNAAKIFFTNIKNNAKIASCLVRLGQYQQAIDSAKKANSPKTWKELCFACIDAQEFRLASIAGLNIIIHPDHLEEISQYYEQHGFAEQMIELLQQGLQSERAHIGVYTELGSLYAKYQPERVMEFCVQYFSKLNVSKLLRVCERYLLWPEVVYLYSHYDEFDNAINIIIEHSPSAFQHEQYMTLIQKVSNQELYYKSIHFYLEEQPMHLNGLLKALANKLDLTKTVQVMKRTGYIALITPFMKSVQSSNNQALNEALNEIYFDNEDHEQLRKSITQYDNFDQQNLAKLTEHHQLSEMRRIAAYLYRKAQKYEKSIELSQNEKQFKDCIEAAAESQKSEIVEKLLNYFVQKGEKEFFTVCTYTCYELIKPDIVLELAWRFGLMDFAMPFMIQVTRELTAKLETVQKKHIELEKKEQKQAQQMENQPLDIGYSMMPGQQMLMPPTSSNNYDQGSMYMQQGAFMNNAPQMNQMNNNPYNQFGGFQ